MPRAGKVSTRLSLITTAPQAHPRSSFSADSVLNKAISAQHPCICASTVHVSVRGCGKLPGKSLGRARGNHHADFNSRAPCLQGEEDPAKRRRARAAVHTLCTCAQGMGAMRVLVELTAFCEVHDAPSEWKHPQCRRSRQAARKKPPSTTNPRWRRAR